MIQKRMEERPYVARDHSRAMGRSSVAAECPFCGATVVIFLWSIAGNGKKLCACGAALHADGVARKLVRQNAQGPQIVYALIWAHCWEDGIRGVFFTEEKAWAWLDDSYLAEFDEPHRSKIRLRYRVVPWVIDDPAAMPPIDWHTEVDRAEETIEHRDEQNHRAPGRDADGEPGNVSE
jgi:hypothetical protein